VEDQDGLAVGGEEHEVGFPVAGLAAILGGLGPLVDRHPILDQQGGTSALLAPPAAPGLGPWQVVTPGAVVGSLHLGVDEPIDGLHPDDGLAGFQPEAAGDLGWGPAPGQQPQNPLPQLGVAVQAGARPASAAGLLLRESGPVASRLATGIALQFPTNARWRAIQSCSDLPVRLTRAM
jgi:hypothetical protein